VAERIKKAYKAMRVILPFVKRTRLPWRLTLRLYSTVIAPVVLYGMPKTYLTKSNRMVLRAMEETIFTTLRKAAVRSADADEELDHRLIEKMLDNKTINNRIKTAPARLRYWGHICRREREHILRKRKRTRLGGNLKSGSHVTHTMRRARETPSSLERIGTLRRIEDMNFI
jgi:hypothetical protein